MQNNRENVGIIRYSANTWRSVILGKSESPLYLFNSGPLTLFLLKYLVYSSFTKGPVLGPLLKDRDPITLNPRHGSGIAFLVRGLCFVRKRFSNKSWRGCGEKGTLLYCWWEWKLVQLLWKTVWRFIKTTEIELPYDPTTPLLGMYPDGTLNQKYICTPMFTAALFTIVKTWKQPM